LVLPIANFWINMWEVGAKLGGLFHIDMCDFNMKLND